MIKKRIKEDKGLEDTFYIVNCSKGDKPWWQLRLKQTHYIFSAVCSKEEVLGCLYRACRKYKTEKRLNRALRKCEHNITQDTFNKLQEEYEKVGKEYSDEVKETVKRAKEDVEKAPQKKRKMFNCIKKEEERVEEKEVTPLEKKNNIDKVIHTLKKKRRGIKLL